MVTARVSRLGSEARTIAEIAAVVGQGFNVEVVREVSGLPEEPVLDGLSELLDRRLVRELVGRSRFDYCFTPHLIQSAIYDEIPAEARKRRHRRIAVVLEEINPNRLDDLASDLALHYDRGGDPERAAQMYARAAKRAFAVYANEEALMMARRGLELASDPQWRFELLALCEAVNGRCGLRAEQSKDLNALEEIATSQRDEHMMCDVLWRRLLLQRAIGQHDDERSLIQRLRAHAAACGEKRWEANALQAEATHELFLGRLDAAHEAASSAHLLQRDLGNTDSQLECLCLLAEIASFRGALSETQEFLLQARSIAQAQPNTSLIAQTTLAAGKAAFLQQNYNLSEQLGREAVDLYRAMGDREGEADAHARIAASLARRFQMDEARRHYGEATATYAAIGKRLGVAATLANSGVLSTWLGRLDSALESQREAEKIFETLGDKRGQTVCAANTSVALFLASDPAGSKTAARRAYELARTTEDRALQAISLGNLGNAECDLGDFGSGIAHMEAGLAMCRTLQRPADYIAQLADLAIAYLRVGDPQAARKASKELMDAAASAGDDAIWPWYWYWAGALVHRASGSTQRAAASLAMAIKLLQEGAARISDPESRTAFLALKVAADLIAAHDKHVWPSFARLACQKKDAAVTPT